MAQLSNDISQLIALACVISIIPPTAIWVAMMLMGQLSQYFGGLRGFQRPPDLEL